MSEEKKESSFSFVDKRRRNEEETEEQKEETAKPKELKQLGGFAGAIVTLGLENVRSRKVVFKQVSEEEAVVSREGLEKVVSITEAARINGVTRQAIYVAIKQKKLKARKDSTRWTIHLDDLEEYRKQKYSRD